MKKILDKIKAIIALLNLVIFNKLISPIGGLKEAGSVGVREARTVGGEASSVGGEASSLARQAVRWREISSVCGESRSGGGESSCVMGRQEVWEGK